MPTTDPDSLTLRKDFEELLDPLTEEEHHALTKKLKAEGCKEKLKVWSTGRVVIDGHNRFGICKKFGIPFEIELMDFPDEEAVKDWIITNQLARRNLNPLRRKYFIGQLYEAEKGKGGGPAAKRVAKQAGVSPRTARRAADFKKALDKAGPETKQAVLTGRVKLKATEAAPPVKKKRKQGGVRFAWRDAERDFGRVHRIPDELARVYGEKLPEDAKEAMLQLTREWKELFEKLRKKLAK